MADNPDRKMLLVAFLQASNCSNYTGSWRHPETDPGFMDLEFYQNIASTLERGKFHLAFIDDRLAMPSRFGDSFADAVENGIRVVKLDLVPIITAMGLAAMHLGLGATYSTTYYSPYHVARLFASLDHFTKGRVAWNVVTSLNDSEAQNFGVAEHLKHDDRYDVADEFLEATAELWDSWEDGAIGLDKQTGQRRCNPKHRDFVRGRSKRLKDAGHVAPLKSKTELNPQKPETHVPDLTERKAANRCRHKAQYRPDGVPSTPRSSTTSGRLLTYAVEGS
jgi:alkanesulfonate monooxygenase SsuD/methylene tetrahydromethanopterin reductase-like flavin-dependent oxidoreductase (luciferase family)